MVLRAVEPLPTGDGRVRAEDLGSLIAEVADTLAEVGLLYTHAATDRPVPAGERDRVVMQGVHLRAATRFLAAAKGELGVLYLDLTGQAWEPA